ncbi:mitochondrial carrier [Rozella allomycis CSF55]|uniref:Mitochondrial carrier n=1 Tax=Rozella allomycis (strain CSF55) TaxID=988480 RepID=A0A4P9YEJ2_ROZAC|nr:mitochondrial carrier [Rozella allomycis CSF55]
MPDSSAPSHGPNPTGIDLYSRFAVAGALCCAITHVDVVKTRIQLEPTIYNQGMLRSAQQIVKSEGIGALATGFGALKFGGYEFFKKKLVEGLGMETAQQNRIAIYLAGSALAEFIADVALCPLEATRIRLVSQPGFASGLLTGFGRILKEEGVLRGFYSGFGPIVLKQVPYTMTKFAVYEVVSEKIYQSLSTPKENLSNSMVTSVNLGSGLIAGTCAAIVSQPADTLLSKINKTKGSSAEGIMTRLIKIAKDLGPRGLFLGLGPRIVMSEYIAPWDARRAFISGFTGSAGFAVISQEKAALWTDGRYFLQASQELNQNEWTLMKQGLAETPSWQEWLTKMFPGKTVRVGVDPRLVTFEMVYITENLIDKVWENRPTPEYKKIFNLPLQFAGQSFEEKLENVRKELEKNRLFNLRGSDVPMNPVFFSYALITKSDCIIYCQVDQVEKEALSLLKGVELKNYDQIFEDLENFKDHSFLVGPTCSVALVKQVDQEKVKVLSPSPLTLLKSIKNDVEIEGFRQCHIRDAAALVKHFKGLSFDTISGSGPNGAVIHYHAKKESARNLSVNEMYLCDSGAQFLDGTTDVTRTVHFGNPTDYEKECFTRVLKGHIAIDSLIFPEGTTGYSIDCLARSALWKVGLNYRHGTGHGVGSFLNVHEGPQGIGPRIGYNNVPLKPNMTVTNDGKFGIRIENVLVVKKVTPKYTVMGDSFLGFEAVTVVPIHKKLITKSLLTTDEIAWINAYHKKVYEKVSPLLEKECVEWLQEQTTPI